MYEPYLDEKEAMGRLGGNKKLYIKLLGRFKEDGSYGKLEEHIAAGDILNAELAAHAIKGMAANLSLKAVYDEAVRTDAMLKEGSINPDIFDGFKKAMDETVNVIDRYISDES